MSLSDCSYEPPTPPSACFIVLALSIVLVLCTAHGAAADQSADDTKVLNRPVNEVGDFDSHPSVGEPILHPYKVGRFIESVSRAVEHLIQDQKYDTATQLLTKALANDPNDKDLRAVVLRTIEQLVDQKQYALAIELLTKAVTNDTNGIYKEALSSVHYRYADYLKSQHDKDGAKREHELGSQLEKELRKNEKRQKSQDEHS